MSIARSHRFNPKAWMAVLLAVLLLVPPVAMAEDEKGPTTPEAKKEEIKRRPLLWRVDTNPPIYLYGTIHVNDERVTKHLPVVQQAIDQSTAVYTELAMDPAGMMAMQQAILKRAPLPEGQTLKALFGDELFERTSKVMPPGTPLFALNGFKPWLVMFMLIQTQMAEHQKQRAKEAKEAGEKPQDPNAESLDPMIFNNARKQGKKVGGLETIDTQIDAFDNIPLEKQVEMVKDSVEAIEKARKKAKGEAVEGDEEEAVDSLGKMVDMWLAGDDVGFAKLHQS